MSSINPNNINGQYPIAGQDNDSQGFRDNFTNIKNNFQSAYNEISDLQNNAILKSALSGGSVSNDMNYTQLIHPLFLGAVDQSVNLNSKSADFSVSWADGHYQYVTVTNNLAITGITDFPTNNTYAKLRLQITTDSTDRTITFPSAVSVGLSSIQGVSGQAVTLPASGVYVFELSTTNNGTTIIICDLLRNTNSGTFTGTVTTSGNLIIGGARRDSGLQYIAPVADFTATAWASNVSRLIFDPTGTITNAILTLPASNISAMVFQVSSTATITNFKVIGSGNVTVKPSANITLTAGTGVTYYYKADEWAWYKIA